MRCRRFGATVLAAFPSVALSAYPPTVPSTLALTVRETAGIARSGEIVRSGIPLPRSLNVRDIATLAIVDSGGGLVPAEFRVLARWDAGRDVTTAPIQWLLVTFPATAAANSSSAYRLVTDGSAGANPAPATPLSLTQSGNQVTVNSGAATFRLGGSANALFDEIRLANGTIVVNASTMTAQINATSQTHPTTRRVAIESSGPLSAVVVIEGSYDLPAVGGGGIGSRRRYLFFAGSPTAVIRQSVAWEGDRCGNGVIVCAGSPNAVRAEQVRDALTTTLAPPLNVTAIGSFAAAALQGTAAAGQTAYVRQQLRPNRTSPLAFDVSVPGTAGATGQKADGGMLSIGDGSKSLTIAINHMHRYEPQALRLLADGTVAIDLADNMAWLGARQGMFTTFAVSALSGNATRSDLDRLVWAPLNKPLHAWPDPAWFAASDAVEEFPVGSLPPDYAAFDTHVENVLNNTLQQTDAVGLAGLMTFGVYPRFWGSPLYSNEVDCGGGDPTPTESFDDTYWCTTFTDYHSGTSIAAVSAMRSGKVEWLDEISTPAALRVLHTQIMQCGPSDTYFYCGQAPAGYGGYRSDFNSSHAYFENLFLYYWFTGDSTVVEMLKRGASTMRDYLCSRRPAAPCLPDDPSTDVYAQFVGRVATQWNSAFRFVGLASDDASYLDDYKANLARAYTQHYVESPQAAVRYGFVSDAGNPLTGPATYPTDQLWMLGLYDMNLLYRLQRDTNDAPIGNPALAPSEIRAAWSRTMLRYGSTVSGNGTASGNWPNSMNFTWTSGTRLNASIGAITPQSGGSDPLLYDSGKANLTAMMDRSALETNDAAMLQMGTDLTKLALAGAQNEFSPIGKIQAEYLAHLPAAIARLAANTTTARRGDVNGDNNITVADIFYLINNLFASGPAPIGSADANADGSVTVADIFFLINYLFAGGAAPPP